MQTVGDVISRIRNRVKSLEQDNVYITDRFVYSLIKKHASWLIKREDDKNRILRTPYIFQTLPFEELITVNAVEAECTGVRSNCTFKRTKSKLPELYNGYYGPLIKTVTSVDGYYELQPTTPSSFARKTRLADFKYNTTKYYWYSNGYLYLPNIEWDAILIQAMFVEDISKYKFDVSCTDCEVPQSILCKSRQEQETFIPDYIFGEMENFIAQDLEFMYKIPPDVSHDKLNINS
jgi:hypothetical protein